MSTGPTEARGLAVAFYERGLLVHSPPSHVCLRPFTPRRPPVPCAPPPAGAALEAWLRQHLPSPPEEPAPPSGRARGLAASQRGAAPSSRHLGDDLANRGLRGRPSPVLDHGEPAPVGGAAALSPSVSPLGSRSSSTPRRFGPPGSRPSRAGDPCRSRSHFPISCVPGAAKILRSAALLYIRLRGYPHSQPGFVQGSYAPPGGGTRPH